MAFGETIDLSKLIEDVQSERPIHLSPSVTLAADHVDYLEVANIAEDLIPRVDSSLQGNSTIRIVGGCGTNLAKEEYPWFDALKKWSDRGCSIDYLMVSPCKGEVNDLMRELSSAGEGRFKGYKVRDEREWSDDAQSLIERWRTFHFCVFEEPELLWVESFHPEGSTKAQDCYFFPEGQTKDLPEFRIYRAQFDSVIQNCTEQI